MPDSPHIPIDFLEELQWRGLIHQCTDLEGLKRHLAAGPRSAYAGFDPTADSLTIGNLVPMMVLRHWQRADHRPIVLMGGGTGLIGDPSGKSAERTLNTKETVEAYVQAQRPIFEAILEFDGPEATRPVVVNNADWLTKISYIDALRDIGKHFSVNMMMQKESVKARLENREQGISYTEFSYMILQAYDFAHLHRSDLHVTAQFGGSDQYGNIVAGIDLVRRQHAHADESSTASSVGEGDRSVFGLTIPLITKSDGGKFGKTETGAVWLTAPKPTDTPEQRKRRTSPYAYFQFWLNAADDDAVRFLKIFTLLPREEIEAIAARHAANPGQREAQRTLAREATTLLHGKDAAERAESAAAALFSGDIAHLDAATIDEVFADIPSSQHATSTLAGEGVDAAELLVATGLAESKKKAREFLAAGAVTVNGSPLREGERLTPGHLLHGSITAIRRGKKAWHLARWA